MMSRPVFTISALLAGILLFMGCQGEYYDVSRLSKPDRILFAVAAAIEDVDITTDGGFWDNKVRYNYNLTKTGRADWDYIGSFDICTIQINPDLVPICPVGGYDQGMIVISRHEIGHCEGKSHSDDPDSVMNPYPPCWPAD